MIVFAVLSPDINFPGSSCLLQKHLGVPGIATLDIRNQCTGFVMAWSPTSSSPMMSGCWWWAARSSSGLDRSTRGRDVTVLFKTGRARRSLAADDPDQDRVILDHECADGSHADILMLPAPASSAPA